MSRQRLWSLLLGKALLVLVNTVSAVALVFEGYNQGVFGTVSETPGFIKMAHIGHGDTVTESTKQGGLAAAYYFGAMWSCFLGGDTIGRKRDTLIGCGFSIVGTALQASSQNEYMFICARIISGIGIGFVNTIIPAWVSELSPSHNRGSSFSLVFVANFVGISLSSWVNFAVRDIEGDFCWRFALGFMLVPVAIVAIVVPALPESPRWLIANSRRDEAIAVLRKLNRGANNDSSIQSEIEQIEAAVETGNCKRNNLLNITLGGRFSGNLHLGRRAAMGFALQWLQQWSGILAVVGWAGTLFKLAGFESGTCLWLAALVNTVGIPGTGAAALVIDRLGRIKSLMISFVLQAVCLFLIAGFTKGSQDASEDVRQALSGRLGMVATAIVILYMWIFTMFNIVPSWLYGSEIWPQEIRAKGYSFTVFGWATGCGMTQFLIPMMLEKLGYATYIFFGVINILSLPAVWLLFPEVAGHTLEETLLLFTSNSILSSSNEEEYRRRLACAGYNATVAVRHLLDEVSSHESIDSVTVDKGSCIVTATEIHGVSV